MEKKIKNYDISIDQLEGELEESWIQVAQYYDKIWEKDIELEELHSAVH